MKQSSCIVFSAMLLMFCSFGQQASATAYRVNSCHPRMVRTLSSRDTLNKFPSFNYPDTSGRKFSLSDLKGSSKTLIVFWASWCAPCRKEIPALKELYVKYQALGLSIISISVDQNMNAWKRAVREEKMPWANIANLPDNHHSIMEHFAIKAVPSLFLLDNDGSILLTDPTLEQVRDRLEK